jgi:anti-sigma-K factor RskA
MSKMEERIEQLLPFYTLGALTPAEKEAVEAYLLGNPQARAELADTDELLSALALSAPPAAPSAHLKKKLMARVQTDAQARSQPMMAPPPPARPSSGLTEFFRRLRSQPGGWLMPALALASLLVALGAGLWAYNLQDELRQLRHTLATFDQNLNQKLMPFEATNTALRQDFSAQAETVATLRRELTNLRTENQTLQQQVADQRQTLSQLTRQMAGLPVDATAPAALNTVQANLANQQEVPAALNEMVTLLTDQITQLQNGNASLRQELSAQRAVVAQLTTPNVQVMLIDGTNTLPNAHGHFVANPADNSALLIVAGLPQLQPNQEYQFWLVQNGTPMRAGTLDVYDDGLGLLLISSSEQIGSFEAMGISIEPAGSSGAPESEMIMLGNLAS